MNTDSEQDEGDERSPLLKDDNVGADDDNLSVMGRQLTDAEQDVEEAQALLDSKSHDFGASGTWKAEAWLLCTYSAPLIPTYLLQYFYTCVTIFVAGHINAESLAAASIGVTTINVIGFAMFEGMATALDTLCAQAYGAGNLKQVGLHVQRMSLAMLVVAIPIGAIWVTGPYWMGLFLRQQELVVMAGSFLRVTLVGLPGYALFESGKRFVQAQGDFTSSLVVLVVCAPVNVFLNWLFVFKLGWGLEGAALAAALTNNLRPVLLLAYILTFKRWTLQCWGGFSPKVFQNWGPMMRLSISGGIVNLAEWFAFEILTFSTSHISTFHLAAQTILTTSSVIVWHIPFSVSIAVTTRIGHLIGNGSFKVARRLAVFYAIIFVLIGIFDMVLFFALRVPIPRIFTSDERVQQIATAAIPVVALFQVIDAILCCCNGILRGLGRQSIAGWTVFLVNYLAAVPFALFLELGKPGWKLEGVWFGLAMGMICIALIETLVMKVLNWRKCVDDARARDETDS